MAAKGASRFDPARFSYIESLARRAARMPEAVRGQLEQRAAKALADYEIRFERAQKEANSLMGHMASAYPEASETLRHLYSEKDFRGIRRMSRKLQRANFQSPLGLLVEQISGESRLASRKTAAFDTPSHRRQDELPDGTDIAPGRNADAPFSNDAPGLKSYQLFRETWARHYSDRLVSDAARNLPKDPGPLNSQLLITRSLIIMRDLSPDYLKRFVSYVDTLLWLEAAAGRLNTP
jgi:hypothetical protein